MKALHIQGGSGKGIPKEREVNRRREACEWEGSVCAREAIWSAIDVKVDTSGCVLPEDMTAK